jgi:nucleoside permease NupC
MRGSAANTFVGQTEAPLMIPPFIRALTKQARQFAAFPAEAGMIT